MQKLSHQAIKYVKQHTVTVTHMLFQLLLVVHQVGGADLPRSDILHGGVNNNRLPLKERKAFRLESLPSIYSMD